MPTKTRQDILFMRWALFSVIGLILLVGLYSLGIASSWDQFLKEALYSEPFLLSPDSPFLTPGKGFLLSMALTLAMVYDLLLIQNKFHKIAVLAIFIILLVGFTPTLALWGVFFTPTPCLISVGSAGILSIIYSKQPSVSFLAPPSHE